MDFFARIKNFLMHKISLQNQQKKNFKRTKNKGD